MNNKAIGEGMKLEGCEKRMRILYVRDSVFMSELRDCIRILWKNYGKVWDERKVMVVRKVKMNGEELGW